MDRIEYPVSNLSTVLEASNEIFASAIRKGWAYIFGARVLIELIIIRIFVKFFGPVLYA